MGKFDIENFEDLDINMDSLNSNLNIFNSLDYLIAVAQERLRFIRKA